MSIDYIITPVTQQLLEWGRECGMPISLDTPEGRIVTRTDLTQVLQSLDGFTSHVRGSEEDFSAEVESVETFEWEYKSANPDLNQAFGGTHTSSKESLNIYRLTDNNQSRFLSLHGGITLIVQFARAHHI